MRYAKNSKRILDLRSDMKIQKYSSIQVFKYLSIQVSKFISLQFNKMTTNQPTHPPTNNVKARDPVGSKNLENHATSSIKL